MSPDVWRATSERSTSSPSGFSRVCTPRIASRPARSGWATDLAVQAAWAKQRRVQILQAVRGADDDDLAGIRKSVQLDEELVQCLVVLPVEGVAERFIPTASSSSMKTIAG